MRKSFALVLFLCALLLTGCLGVPVSTTNSPSSVPGVAVQGKIHGGQQPIAGARVYLYAANTIGYGSASVSLLKSASGTSEDGRCPRSAHTAALLGCTPG